MCRWCLIWVCFFATPLMVQSGAEASLPSFANPSEATWPADVTGYGVTIQDAKDDALRHLVQLLSAALHHQDSSLRAWQPTTDYVKLHLLRGDGKPGEDVHVEGLISRKAWTYTVTPLDWPALTALDEQAQRLARRRERLVWGWWAIGGGVLVLALLMTRTPVQVRCRLHP